MPVQETVAEHDRRSRSEPRAGRDADKAGIGERIAEQPLHQRARYRERRADQKAEQHARQADVQHDEHVAAFEQGGVPGKPRP